MRWLARSALIAIVAAMLGVISFTIIGTQHAEALSASRTTTFASTTGPDAGGAPAECPKPRLLGVFVPWYEYLTVEKDDTKSCAVQDFHLLAKDGESSDVPLVVIAIIDDLLRLAGLIAVIFVIYGGVQYATSQGSPEAAAKAQSTILNALIGLAIAMVAIAFVTYLGRMIG